MLTWRSELPPPALAAARRQTITIPTGKLWKTFVLRFAMSFARGLSTLSYSRHQTWRCWQWRSASSRTPGSLRRPAQTTPQTSGRLGAASTRARLRDRSALQPSTISCTGILIRSPVRKLSAPIWVSIRSPSPMIWLRSTTRCANSTSFASRRSARGFAIFWKSLIRTLNRESSRLKFRPSSMITSSVR